MTILFTDVVGSTGLAERLGPDAWSDLMEQLHARVGRVVEAHGGTVAQVLGDGLLAFFGAPEAHEDDCLRAVSAGLDLIEAVRGSDQRDPDGEGHSGPGLHDAIEVRVGVESGVVVVGEVGTERHVERLAFGDAVNVAARLQGLATPMTVRISESVYRLVSGAVEVRECGEATLKGRTAGVRTYEVLRRRPEPAVRGDGPPRGPLIGRERELRALVALSARLGGGQGGTVLISGEPGIGKTRLIAEWRAAAGVPDAIRWIEVGCHALGQDQPYDLTIRLTRALLGGASPAGSPEALERARAEVSAAIGPRSVDAWPYLAHLTALPLDPEAADLVRLLDARALQRQVRRSLRLLLAGVAERTPLVLVIEDAHWIDPSSAELLAGLLPLVAEVPLVVACASRPESQVRTRPLLDALRSPTWAAPPIVLGPLSQRESSELLRTLLPGGDLGSDDEQRLHRRCGGNPFFLEEVVHVLVERAGADPGSVAPPDPASEVIPETLHALLVARIERLPGSARSILRMASVIGPRFRVRLLSAVAATLEDASADAVSRALDEAVAAGLVEPVQGAPEPESAFRHALIQEAAYDLIVKRQRAPLHRAVAEAIRRIDADRIDEVAVVLARHLRLGGDPVGAVDHLALGASVAASRFADGEAATLLREALELARDIEDDGSTARLAGLHEQLGDTLSRSGHHDGAVAAWEAALGCRPPDELLARARLRRKLGVARVVAGEGHDDAGDLGLAEAILETEAGERGEDWWREWIEVQLGRIWKHYFRAEAADLRAVIDRAREPVIRHGTATQRAVYLGRDPLPALISRRFRVVDADDTSAWRALEAAQEAGSASLLAEAHFTFGLWRLCAGALEDAEEHLLTCRRLAERIGDRTWECRARNYLVHIARLRRDAAAVRVDLEGLETLALEAGLNEYVASCSAQAAWLAWLEGDDPAAESAARRSLALSRAVGPSWPFEWLALFPLLAIALARGDDVAAVDLARQLLAPSQQLLDPEVWARLERGARPQDPGPAAADLHAAVDAARGAGYL